MTTPNGQDPTPPKRPGSPPPPNPPPTDATLPDDFGDKTLPDGLFDSTQDELLGITPPETPDVDQTMPEDDIADKTMVEEIVDPSDDKSEFDQTMVEESFGQSAAKSFTDQTMTVDELDASDEPRLDVAATLPESDSPVVQASGESQTMLEIDADNSRKANESGGSFDVGATLAESPSSKSAESDFEKTLSDEAFADVADDQFANKTMAADAEFDPDGTDPGIESTMQDSSSSISDEEFDANRTMPVTESEGSSEPDASGEMFAPGATIADSSPSASNEIDVDKTLPGEALMSAADEDFAGRTMIVEPAGQADVNDPAGTDPGDDFGKTMAMESDNVPPIEGGFEARTMMDGGGEPEIEGDKTMVLPEEGENLGGRTMIVSSDEGEPPAETFPGSPRAQPLPQTHDGTMALGANPDFTRTSGAKTESGVIPPKVPDPKSKGTKSQAAGLNIASRGVSGFEFPINPAVDYRLTKKLGEGGMGIVYVAQQASLGRDVVFKTLKAMPATQSEKLKASGQYKSVTTHRSQMFVSEAVVTADLFHPNIVPIYDMGEAPDGSMFYTMKWVRGTGWNKLITELSLEENLEILMKISDAIAFSHSRNIINRDLKPENVMIGEFGEVNVLDWGLALPFGEGKDRLPLAVTAGLGAGTPAYMPPELITGPLSKIGPGADIYLLGAMLFEAATGVPPHDFQIEKTQSATAKLQEIRRVVCENVIRETIIKGELIDIAHKAMATKPQDRYSTVIEFQQAIREYQKHAASRTLVDRAKEFTATKKPGDAAVAQHEQQVHGYTNYQSALALYNESLREWPGNSDARVGLTETQLHFAQLALTKGDFDLGLSVLDTNADSHSDTRTQLVKAREERDGRVRRMKLLKVAASVMAIGLVVFLAVAARLQFNLKEALTLADKAKEMADKAEVASKAAKAAQAEAEIKQDLAEKSLITANDNIKIADGKLKVAAEQLMVADTKLKDADVKLIDANKKAADLDIKVTKANENLATAQTNLTAAQTNLKKATDEFAVKQVEFKEKLGVAEERTAKANYLAGLAEANRYVQEGRYSDARRRLQLLKADYADRCKSEWDRLWDTVNAAQAVSLSKPVESISVSRDGKLLAAADNSGGIVVWDVDQKGQIVSDTARKFALGSRPRMIVLSPDGAFVAAAAEDAGIHIWSIDGMRPKVVLKGHEGPVNAVKFSNDGKQLVSGSDDRTIRLWDFATSRELTKAKALYAVMCLDWSRDGKILVAGTSSPEEVAGVAYSWEIISNTEGIELSQIRTFQVPPVGKVKQDRGVVAIALTNDGQYAVSNGPAAELHLWQVDPRKSAENKKLIKVNVASILLGQHSKRVERVRSLAFSASGTQLLVGGDDGTITIWKNQPGDGLPKFERTLVLYGHSGPVRTCLPLPQSPDLVVSGSYDQHVHVWNLTTYPDSRRWLDHPEEANAKTASASLRERREETSRSNTRWSGAIFSFIDRQIDIRAGERGGVSPPVRENVSSVGTIGGLTPPRSPEACLADGITTSVSAHACGLRLNEQVQQPPSVPIRLVSQEQKPDESKEQNPTVQIVTGHTDSVLSAVFSRDGRRILSASRDQTARVWDSESGKPVGMESGQDLIFDDNVFAEGHDYDLFAMRFFPKGDLLLTSGFDGSMRLWDSRISAEESFGRELATLPETGMYGVVEVSRDGQWIITAGRKNSAQLWNTDRVLNSRRPRPDRILDGQHRYRVTCVAISPDSNYLLTGDREGFIVIWDLKTGAVVGRQRNSHIGEVVKAEFLQDRTQLLTAGVDRRVVKWDLTYSESGVSLRKAPDKFDHAGIIVNLSVSPKFDRFISVSRRGNRLAKVSSSSESATKVSLWDLKTGTERALDLPTKVQATDLEKGGVPSPAWAADGVTVVITSPDGGIHFVDSNTALVTQSLQVENNDQAARRAQPFAVLLRPDEPTPEHIVTQTHNAAYLWRLKDGVNLVSFRPQGPVFSAGFSSDGQVVVTGGRSLRLFDSSEKSLTYGRLLHKVEYPHMGITSSVEFSPVKGSYRFLSTSYDESAKIWEWQPARRVAKVIQELSGHDGPVRFGTWSADGSRVLTVGHDAQPRVWSITDGKPPQFVLLKLAAADQPNEQKPDADASRDYDQICGAFSWNGQFVAIGGRDVGTGESIGWIWNLIPDVGNQPILHATIRGHGLGGINSVAFLPDDDRLLTAGADGTARLWDWQKDSKPLANEGPLSADFLITMIRAGEVTTHRGAVTSVRVTPAGTIVSASSDGTVIIWPNPRGTKPAINL